MSQNYKDTLNLPRTDFPMKANLAAREPEMLRNWEEKRLYQEIQKSREGRELFVLHDGPPFANGDVHMGTALNKILKDFVVKSQTMLGKRAPYVPGWDCHGLANRIQSGQRNRASFLRWRSAKSAKRLRENSSTSSANNSSGSACSATGNIRI